MDHAIPILRRAARRLGRDEGGSMTVFGLFLFLMMLMVGGMAVDLIRYETNRTRLQATLDRAILAAADLEQTEDPEAVVRDYFRAAGLLNQLGEVEVTGAINSRTVSATASVTIDTFFMDLVGVEALEAPAAGIAAESVKDIEIVLVLDVSGSMNDNNRIVLLRAAAREFIGMVLEADTEDRVSISIVPFNAQVNLGATLMNGLAEAGYAVTHRHGEAGSNCIDEPPDVYATLATPAAVALPQAGFYDPFTDTTRSATTYVAPLAPNFGRLTCRTNPDNVVHLPSQDIAVLQNQIQDLDAVGETSITRGMDWGLALLDPGSRRLYSDLMGAGHIPATLRDRPYNYDREHTLKVVVLMTDGEHVQSHQLEDGYRTEVSPIYQAGDGRYSIHHDREDTDLDYWVPHLDTDADSTNGVPGNWRRTPWDGTSDEDTDGAGPDGDTDNLGVVTRLRWHEVWRRVPMRWVAWHLYARPLDTAATSRTDLFNRQMDAFIGLTIVADMDRSLQQSCALARQNGVVVYGIAFEAPPPGETQIYNCASSPSHFYDAQGLEIATAFRSIAAQINALRLKQ